MDRQNRDEYSVRCRNRINILIHAFCDGVQQTFADRTGLRKASINQYVRGRNVPNNLSVKKIADAFAVNPSWVNGFPSEYKSLAGYPADTRETLERIIKDIQNDEYDIIYDKETVSIYKDGELVMPFLIEDIVRIYKNASSENDVVTVSMLTSSQYDTEEQKMERKLHLYTASDHLSSALGVNCTDFITNLSLLNKAGISEIMKRAKEFTFIPDYCEKEK